MAAAVLSDAGRVGIGAHIVVEFTGDRHCVARVIDALEACLAAQAEIAVSDVVGQRGKRHLRPPKVTRADQRAGPRHAAARRHSTYCRMPPARKYSSSL